MSDISVTAIRGGIMLHVTVPKNKVAAAVAGWLQHTDLGRSVLHQIGLPLPEACAWLFQEHALGRCVFLYFSPADDESKARFRVDRVSPDGSYSRGRA